MDAKRCEDVFVQSQSDDTLWMQSMAPMRRDHAPAVRLCRLEALDWYVDERTTWRSIERCYEPLDVHGPRVIVASMVSMAPRVQGLRGPLKSLPKDGVSCALNALMVRARTMARANIVSSARKSKQGPRAGDADVACRHSRTTGDEPPASTTWGITDEGLRAATIPSPATGAGCGACGARGSTFRRCVVRRGSRRRSRGRCPPGDARDSGDARDGDSTGMRPWDDAYCKERPAANACGPHRPGPSREREKQSREDRRS